MTWTDHELTLAERTDELEIAPRRDDGILRSPVPIWGVRDGDDLGADTEINDRIDAAYRPKYGRHNASYPAGPAAGDRHAASDSARTTD
ncbi:DUF2255 family protein [Saccharopolyspora spinosa]|uniref:Uncharacterized protein n=1 Tax=Saccharopolyspora spinosa TaxID=60894 RepID=A0A2N3Y0R3_SACSN|nr:hypothetical protein [Saccharopolyspora spinosa]PKW16497.1 hypothetical protein A8926_4335 [Saccharopolyspora spinosa]